MEIVKDSLDDVLMALYRSLLDLGQPNKSSRGDTRELLGVLIHIRRPRARLSRSENRGKPFSALGELLWYLSKQNDLEFIKEYVPHYKTEAEPDGTIHGGYGPRLFSKRGSINQIENVIELLQRKPGTRRAVVQLYDAEDLIGGHKEVPCTTTIQLLQRDTLLHMAVTLRSNDAYKGLPHDVFCFTMLQEMLACRLGLDLGEYKQFVGSMHFYAEDHDKLLEYMKEGFHKVAEMPEMPKKDPFGLVPTLLECERQMRERMELDASSIFPDQYWADILRLMQAFWASGKEDKLDKLIKQFVNRDYATYVESRRQKPQR